MKRDETVVEMVNGCITAEHISQLGTVVGQSPSVIRQALEPLISLIVRTMADQVTRPHGVDDIWELTRQTQETPLLPRLNALTIARWRRRGEFLLQNMLRDTYETTTSHMATKAGLPLSSYALVIEVAVAAVLGGLSQYAAKYGLDAHSLSRWLQSQPRAAAAARLPQPQPQPERLVATDPAPVPAPLTSTPPNFTTGAGTWNNVGGGSVFTPRHRTSPRLSLNRLHRWKWALLLLPALAIGYGLLSWNYSPQTTAAVAQATPVVKQKPRRRSPELRPRQTAAPVSERVPAAAKAVATSQAVAGRGGNQTGTFRRYRVRVETAYFFDAPDQAKPTGKYLRRGDVLYGEEESGGFVKTRFANSEGVATTGWLKLQELSKLTENSVASATRGRRIRQRVSAPAAPSESGYETTDVPAPSKRADVDSNGASMAVVQVDESYFYDSPHLMQPRKAHCVRGDKVRLGEESGDAVYVTFTNWEKVTTTGWMRKDALR